ncbi:MAG: RluA family pseudouridine synthase [Acidobacteriota bacterium]
MSARRQAEPRDWRVDAEASGERLDRHLAARLDVSRSRVQGWIRDGHVRVESAGSPATAKPSLLLNDGDRVVVTPPPAPRTDPRVAPEAGPLQVLWKDDDLVVLDKPADLAVHPGAGRPDGTLANRLLHRWPEIAGVGGEGRPGIVHRLDLDTTGALVVARTEAAHRALAAAFAERRVDKTYVAVVHGSPRESEGVIEAPIGRHPSERKKMTVREDGRPARSVWRRLDAAPPHAALLAVDLDTGRTHQIRVHLKSIGHPLVGDPVYGEARWRGVHGPARAALRAFARPALHAARLGFAHPRDGRRVVVEAPVPADLRELWHTLAGRPVPPLDLA